MTTTQRPPAVLVAELRAKLRDAEEDARYWRDRAERLQKESGGQSSDVADLHRTILWLCERVYAAHEVLGHLAEKRRSKTQRTHRLYPRQFGNEETLKSKILLSLIIHGPATEEGLASRIGCVQKSVHNALHQADGLRTRGLVVMAERGRPRAFGNGWTAAVWKVKCGE